MCAILCLSLSSCERSIYAMEQDAKREAAYNEGYDVGYEEGQWDGHTDGWHEGYDEGHKDACADFEEIINYDAVFYAKEYSEFHPEEAMQIIELYESEEAIITESEYKEAVKSLFYYSKYFYHDLYK